MKQLLLFLSLLVLATQTFSQTDEMEMYYPEIPLFRKLKVKSVLDTIASPAFHHNKKEYDTLGRQVSWYYVEDSVITRFRYVRSSDTLKKYHYYTKGGVDHPVYQTEFFLYDKKGNILTYQNCKRNHDFVNTSDSRVDKFFYDETFRLISKHIYNNRNYKQQYSETLLPEDSLLKLINVYSYQYHRNVKLIIRKQMIGEPEHRSIGSFYYDKTGRPIKYVRRQKRGYLGEIAVANLCWKKFFEYETNRQIETTLTIYSDWEIDKKKTTNKEVNEYHFYPNGLKWLWYHKPGDYPKSILSYLVYEFYQ
jgi:hypothetical protein